MNFIEAAEHILRAAGKPLHYKKITEIALAGNLLSHVGKTPEITMSSRLAMSVKKDRGDAPIIKVKPGVFGLREFSKPVIQAAMKDDSAEYAPEVDDIATQLASRERENKTMGSEDATESAQKKLPGHDVFPEEADDDEPILANLDEEGGENAEGGDADGRRGGRRRRRGRRGRREREEGGRPSQGGGEQHASNGGGRDRERGGGRGESRHRGEPRHSGAPRSGGGTPRVNAREEIRGEWSREAEDREEVGSSLADATYDVAVQFGEATSFVRLAEQLTRRGRLQGDPNALAPTVAAAVRSDAARRGALGLRPRFYVAGSQVALTDWGLSREALHAERDAVRFAERQRKAMRRALLREVDRLPPVGLIELVAAWLNAEGVSSLRAVRRPGAHGPEFALAGRHQRGPEDRALAVLFLREGAEITAERVIELRGALHHFDNADAAWIITTGRATPEARAEANAAGSTPITVIDGIGLSRAMERARIGLVAYAVPTLAIDFTLFESLGADLLTSRDRMRAPEGEGASAGGEDAAPAEGEASAAAPDGEPGDEQRGRRRRRRGGRGRGRGPEGDEAGFDSLAPAGEGEGAAEAAADEDSGADDDTSDADADREEAEDFAESGRDDEDSSLDDSDADDSADEDESTASPEDAEESEEREYHDRDDD